LGANIRAQAVQVSFFLTLNEFWAIKQVLGCNYGPFGPFRGKKNPGSLAFA